MSTSLPGDYEISKLDSIDPFNPLQYISGRSGTGERLLIRNDTYLRSYVNRRRGPTWAWPDFPRDVVYTGYTIIYVVKFTMSEGRDRLQLYSDAQETRVRMAVVTTDLLTPVGGPTVNNNHGIGRSQLTSNYTGITQQNVAILIALRRDAAINGTMWQIKVRERFIQSGSL